MWYGSVTAGDVPAEGVLDLAYDWHGGTFFTLAGNGSVSRWDLASRTRTPLFGVDASDFWMDCRPRLAVSPNDRYLLATDNERIAVWNLGAGEPGAQVDCHDGSINYPCFVEAGRELYTVCVSAHWLIRWSWPGLRQLEIPDQLRDMTEFAFAAAANLFGTRLAVFNSGGFVVLWDVAAGRLLLTLETGAGDFDDVPMAFSPRGETFVIAHDRTLRVYDVRRGRPAHSIAVEPGSVSRIAFHPAGLVFATAGASPLVTLWEVERGRRMGTWELPFQAVRSLAFSNDHVTCAAGGDGRDFAVWDVEV
jgi:WD40 repeat protein